MSNDSAPSPAEIAEILAQIEQRYPEVAKILSLIEKLDRAAKTQFWIAVLYRPDLCPGIIPTSLPYLRYLRERERRSGKCREENKDKKYERIKNIDALLNDDFLPSQIYEQMRIKHEDIMPGKQEKIMQSYTMWRSYFESGGSHPKALAQRAVLVRRPPKRAH
jgi:hypothetical protein